MHVQNVVYSLGCLNVQRCATKRGKETSLGAVYFKLSSDDIN